MARLRPRHRPACSDLPDLLAVAASHRTGSELRQIDLTIYEQPESIDSGELEDWRRLSSGTLVGMDETVGDATPVLQLTLDEDELLYLDARTGAKSVGVKFDVGAASEEAT